MKPCMGFFPFNADTGSAKEPDHPSILYVDNKHLLPCEWEDQSIPVSALYLTSCITNIATINYYTAFTVRT